MHVCLSRAPHACCCGCRDTRAQMACVWHLVVVLEGADENWVNANEAGSLEGFNEWSIYAAAFYTVMQGLVMGYPNLIYPITTAERIIAIFVMFFLGAIYGYVIGACVMCHVCDMRGVRLTRCCMCFAGSICDTVSNLDPATNEFQANMDHLTRWRNDTPTRRHSHSRTPSLFSPRCFCWPHHCDSFMHEIAYPKKQKRMVREYFHHCK